MSKDMAPLSSAAGSERHSPAQLADALLQHWRAIVITTLVFLVLGVVYAIGASPVYQGNLLIKIDERPEVSGPTTPALLDNVAPSFDAKANALGEMQVLSSRLVVARAVKSLRLDIHSTPERFPLLGGVLLRLGMVSPHPVFGFGQYAWGHESIDVTSFEVPQQLEGKPFTVTALANGRYELSGQGIGKALVGAVGGAQISTTGVGTTGQQATFATSAGAVKLLVNSIAARPGVRFSVTRLSTQDVVDAIRSHLQVIEQGEKSDVFSITLRGGDAPQLAATLNAIGDGYIDENNIRKATIAANSLKFLEDQLPAMRAEMEAAEQRYNDYRNTNTIVDTSEEGKLALQKIAAAQVQLLDLRKTRVEMADRFEPSHPAMKAIDAQIALTQQYIDQQNREIQSMPQEEQGVLGLMREVRVTTDLYSAVRNNIQQLRLVQAGKAGSAQMIDQAEAPDHPVRPQRALVVMVSALLGFFLSVAVTLVRHLLFAGVMEPGEIESGTQLVVYAMVPDSARQREIDQEETGTATNPAILSLRYPRDPAVEALRSFRSALQFAMMEARNNIVMLSGPLPWVGKTFVTTNMAAILSMAGKRVLLIDGDLRKGRLHRSFGVPAAPGVADVLAEPGLLGSAIRRKVMPNLDVLTCGAYPPNPSELLEGDAFGDMLHQVSSQYDIVVLDSAPALAVSDSAIMAPFAGSVFIVARFSETRVAEIDETVRRFHRTGARVNGVMLNGFAMRRLKYLHPSRYGSHAYVASRYDGSAV